MQQLQAARRIVLARRPAGVPVDADFRLETLPVPVPAEGQVLLRTLWLSLDPYMRGGMDGGFEGAPAIGDTMGGEGVGVVEQSRSAGFAPGDLALGPTGWQDHAVCDAGALRKIEGRSAPPQTALGVLGMTGMTAWIGVTRIAVPAPGETFVVSAASGAVGSVAGQIAGILGARVVGIAGGPAKCDYLLRDLGFSAAVDHRGPDPAAALRDACPNGIDVVFENVGGAIWPAVMELLNDGARVAVCGAVAEYNGGSPAPAPGLRDMVIRRLAMTGFLVDDHAAATDDFLAAMTGWISAGRIRWREDVTDGLERAPERFIAMLQGGNFGKTLIRVADDPA